MGFKIQFLPRLVDKDGVKTYNAAMMRILSKLSKFIKFHLLLWLPLPLRKRLPRQWRKVFKQSRWVWKKTRIGKKYFLVNISERKRVNWYFNEVSEEKEFNVIASHLTRDSVFFDVGAHIGLFSIFAADLCSSVHAFEPAEEIFYYLKYNIRLNNRADTIVANRLALSDREGSSPLYIYDTTVFSSLSHNPMRGKIVKKEKVLTATLDSYCEKYGIIPTFIKIDVEGFEGHVLRGGMRTLTHHSPAILCELDEQNYSSLGFKIVELRRFLSSLGYQEAQQVNSINFLFTKEG